MSSLSLNSAPYLRLSHGRAGVVVRPSKPSMGLSGLGNASVCGPEPGLGPGEFKKCCPDVGWVIYDSSESPYGICDRAAGGGGGGSSEESLPSDPMERVEERRRRLEERRLAAEEARHQRQIQAFKLKSVIGQIDRIHAQESAAAAARAKARADQAERERKERLTKTALTAGAIAFAAYLAFRR